jgi:serine/threonine protein kinase
VTSGASLPPPVVMLSLSDFKKSERVGMGTYGAVFKATQISTGRTVALKKIKLNDDKEGIPKSAIRELRTLQMLKGSKSIVELIGIGGSRPSEERNRCRGSLYFVLEFAEHDLTGFLESRGRQISLPEAKCLACQLLTAVDFCHMKGILHRDLKCANLLIDSRGILKLADFGLAREFQAELRSTSHLTSKVVTVWYRPPELLLGETCYGPEVDMWGAGAIIAELLVGRPVFSAEKEKQVFDLIVDQLGTYYYWETLPMWEDWKETVLRPERTGAKLRTSLMKGVSEEGWALVRGMLDLDPKRRAQAAKALSHAYFEEIPIACKPGELKLPLSDTHSMKMKAKRQRVG